ncbi:hypothetical protein CR513_16887, partial [Mucuna pruriens]
MSETKGSGTGGVEGVGELQAESELAFSTLHVGGVQGVGSFRPNWSLPSQLKFRTKDHNIKTSCEIDLRAKFNIFNRACLVEMGMTITQPDIASAVQQTAIEVSGKRYLAFPVIQRLDFNGKKCINIISSEKIDARIEYSPSQINPPIHSVQSSSLHLTRLTCLQEVNISPNHQYQRSLPHHHLSHSGGDPIDPNQLLPEHQQRPESLLESTYAEV